MTSELPIYIDKLISKIIFIGSLVIFTGDTQLQFLNLAIRLYDQLAVVPIYQTFVLLTWTCIGLFILEEYKNYEKGHLGGIVAGIIICILGVKALTMKYRGKINDAEEAEKKAKEEAEIEKEE